MSYLMTLDEKMLAIIGGTGIYSLDEIEVTNAYQVDTPFGPPSGEVLLGTWGKHPVLFLPRHGSRHQLLPHEINYRANVFALKKLGATQLVSLSAVGSLSEDIAPGHLAIADQYFDWTRGKRAASFFGDGVVAHVSTASPASRNLIDWLASGAKALGLPCHPRVTYAGVEGPRLGTQAESHFLRTAGCQTVGMTNVPEAFLAREAQICYASMGIVTDYDCWMQDPEMHVKATEIFALYRESIRKAVMVLRHVLSGDLAAEEEDIRSALAFALLTPPDALSQEQREFLEVLRK